MAFGETIRRLRKEARLSQAEVAHSAGITQGYLSDLERGLVTNPSPDVLQGLGVALGVPATQLSAELLGESAAPVRRLPGTADLPPGFARVIQRIGQQLDARDWEIAAAFLEGLAARRGAPPGPQVAEDPLAYGHQVGAEGDADQEEERQRAG